jgi:hypothetical protein
MYENIKQVQTALANDVLVTSGELRTLLNKNTDVKLVLIFEAEYNKYFNQLVDIARTKIKDEGGSQSVDIDGVDVKAKDLISVKDKTATFEVNRKIMKLVTGLKKDADLGHANLSVQTARISLMLSVLKPTDERYKPLGLLLAACQKVDRIKNRKVRARDIYKELNDEIALGRVVEADLKTAVDMLTGINATMNLQAEPVRFNRSGGGTLGVLGKLTNKIFLKEQKALERLANKVKLDMVDIASSPTIRQRLRKDLVSLIDPKKKRKKSKTHSGNVKTKTTGIKNALKPKKAKPRRKIPLDVISKQQENPATHPLALIAFMNKALPRVVEKNMKYPALENQTGRFARSVKIVDSIQTPQGFTSYGYTYMKDPYQVYETSSGSRFADADRDPRKVIDLSIRELATRFALGRFFTRRV